MSTAMQRPPLPCGRSVPAAVQAPVLAPRLILPRSRPGAAWMCRIVMAALCGSACTMAAAAAPAAERRLAEAQARYDALSALQTQLVRVGESTRSLQSRLRTLDEQRRTAARRHAAASDALVPLATCLPQWQAAAAEIGSRVDAQAEAAAATRRAAAVVASAAPEALLAAAAVADRAADRRAAAERALAEAEQRLDTTAGACDSQLQVASRTIAQTLAEDAELGRRAGQLEADTRSLRERFVAADQAVQDAARRRWLPAAVEPRLPAGTAVAQLQQTLAARPLPPAALAVGPHEAMRSAGAAIAELAETVLRLQDASAYALLMTDDAAGCSSTACRALLAENADRAERLVRSEAALADRRQRLASASASLGADLLGPRRSAIEAAASRVAIARSGAGRGDCRGQRACRGDRQRDRRTRAAGRHGRRKGFRRCRSSRRQCRASCRRPCRTERGHARRGAPACRQLGGAAAA